MGWVLVIEIPEEDFPSWIKWQSISGSLLSRFSHVLLFVTPWTVSLQAPLSMGFSRQEYWIGLPCPTPGGLSDPGIKHLVSCIAGEFFTNELPVKPKTSLAVDFSLCISPPLFSFLVWTLALMPGEPAVILQPWRERPHTKEDENRKIERAWCLNDLLE